MLAKVQQLGRDFTGLQETSSGKTEFSAARYRISCSGQEETKGRQGFYGVGLAVTESIRRTLFTPIADDERLMSMRFESTVSALRLT